MMPASIADAERGGGAADVAELASLVAARLCHDLVSPLGAIGNGVELLEMSGTHAAIASSPELMLISDSVGAARARLRFYRAAFGHAPVDQRIALGEVAQLCQDYVAGSRLKIELEARGDLARIDARMVLLAVLCLDSAMPWGGRVLICRSDNGWRLVGEATRMRIERPLWHLLDTGFAPGIATAPTDVHFAVLSLLARSAGRRVAWEVDESGGEISF